MVVAAPKDNKGERLESVPIHGLHVHRIDMVRTLDTIDRFIREGSPHHVITLDASMCVTAKDDAELRNIADGAELVTPDGAGILWACRRFGSPLIERVSGVEIVERRPGSEVRRAAETEGLTSLRTSALQKVFSGISTLHEINRVTFVEELNGTK